MHMFTHAWAEVIVITFYIFFVLSTFFFPVNFCTKMFKIPAIFVHELKTKVNP